MPSVPNRCWKCGEEVCRFMVGGVTTDLNNPQPAREVRICGCTCSHGKTKDERCGECERDQEVRGD